MSELILELYSEEIPARMQAKAESAFKEIFTRYLAQYEVNFNDIETYSSPCRLTLRITGLPEKINAKEIEVKGPKIDSLEAAISGFAKANNTNLECLVQKEIKGQVFYFYIKKQPEIKTDELLLKLLPQALGEYTWPKSMQWGNYSMRWVRPLKSILCLLDGKILPLQFGHLSAGDVTYGHKFMAPGPIKVTGWKEYEEKLKENYVIIDRQQRRKMIIKQLEQTAQQHKLALKTDEALLDEVTGLVEYPNVLIGKIAEKFLQVPSEVLVTSMKTHQKFFSAYDMKGNFAPYFLFVSNLKTSNDQQITSGNEKVLAARLSDALYFYQQDLTKTLQSRLSALDVIIFHAKLGSLKAKTERLQLLSSYLAPKNKELQLAAKLCKSDLTSEVVAEFPELQGIMGGYYAEHEKLGSNVAKAIKYHYQPVGAEDSVPGEEAALLSLADKIDSLVGLSLAGEEATGSKDPYALRRYALGIIRIILVNQLNLNLKQLVEFTAGLYDGHLHNHLITQKIIEFLEERAKHYFRNKYDIKLVNAVLDLNIEPDLLQTELKLAALDNFLASSEGDNLLQVYKRAANILEGCHLKGSIDPQKMTSNYEKLLEEELQHLEVELTAALALKDFIQALALLSNLLKPVANFFDNVMVKDQDLVVANNRLLLLKSLTNQFDKIAKFNYL